MSNLTINNKNVQINEQNNELTVLEFLHHELNLTGTKYSCGVGICKSCTVAIRKKSTEPYSASTTCTLPIQSVKNFEILTVESLTKNGKISELQKIFLEEFSFQCGYCTPGFLMSTFTFLDYIKRNPSKIKNLNQEIESWFQSNLCRCTGYENYFKAIKKTVEKSLNSI